MGNSKIVYYGETLIDLTGDTVTEEKLLKGITAHDKSGTLITGTFEAADPYAVIAVAYPSGSICTCTDGTKTLSLKDTSGQGFFLIPYAATWTVTASDGTNTKFENVEITSEGQSVSVTLSYQLIAFDNGVIAPEFGEISLAVAGTGGLTDEGLLRLGGDAYTNDKATFTGAINPSNAGYKTFKMLITSSESGGTFGLSSDSNTSTTNWIASNKYKSGLADAVVSCPIDAVNADCYIKVISSNNSSGRKYANISKIWLE